MFDQYLLATLAVSITFDVGGSHYRVQPRLVIQGDTRRESAPE